MCTNKSLRSIGHRQPSSREYQAKHAGVSDMPGLGLACFQAGKFGFKSDIVMPLQL